MMAEETGKARLGRGLAALIGEVGDEMQVMERARGARKVPIEFLRPNPRNPRKVFPESELSQLSVSIRSRGIIQPIVVRAMPGMPDVYEIVAGERRWRAAQMAKLHEVPVVIIEADDKTAFELAVLENVQRQDLRPLDEANGYQVLVEEHGYTQESIAVTLGRSRSHVANMIRLLNLDPRIQEMLNGNNITVGHARALLACHDPWSVAQRIVDEELTVRDVEQIAHADHGNAEYPDAAKRKGGRPRKAKPEKDADTRAVEKALEDVLGLKVDIDHRGEGGELRIAYGSFDQLDGLCRRLHEAMTRVGTA